MADAWGASWGGTFIVWEAFTPVSPPQKGTYGYPFVDFSLELPHRIDRLHKMTRDLVVTFPSTRIDIDGESEP